MPADQARAGLKRQLLAALGTTALVLGLNVVTGALLSRTLGPEGRGAYVAIVSLPQTVGWLGALGCVQALSYLLSRHRTAGIGALVGGWLAILAPVTVVLLLATQAALPRLFAAQEPNVVSLARLFVFILLLDPLVEISQGVLQGRRDFKVFNALRLSQPVVMAVALIGAAASAVLSLQVALLIAAAGTLTAAFIGFGRVIQFAGGLRLRPRRALQTLPYALRAHGANVGSLLNARLDLLILPMLLGAGSIGFYSVAAGISLIVPGLAGSVAYVLFPELARRRREGGGLVVRSALIALIGAGILAIPLGLSAEVALTFVYGAAFMPSGILLRILLVGTVLNAGAFVLATGLTARGFPGRAAFAQACGVLVTLVGLFSLVERGGVVAAAWVSTASYATVFTAACLLYAHVLRHHRADGEDNRRRPRAGARAARAPNEARPEGER